MKSAEYSDIQPIVNNGDLIEIRSEGLIGKAIRIVTGQYVNHSALVVVFNLHNSMYSRRYIIEADEKGFHLSYLSDVVARNSGRIYWSKVSPLWHAHRESFAMQALALEGRPYDWADLINNISGPVRLDATKLFCSEAIQAAAIGAYMIPNDFNDGMALRPGELHKMGIWEQPIIVR